MGTKRTSKICGLVGGLVLSWLWSPDAQVMLAQDASNNSMQTTYDQPQRQEQYQQQFQSPNDFLQQPQFNRDTPSIQDRAGRLLHRQRSAEQPYTGAYENLSSSFSSQTPSSNIGFRKPRLEDPFGENQAQDVQPPPQDNIQFDPFADPPSGEPKQQPRDPFGDGQAQQKTQPQGIPTEFQPAANQPPVIPSETQQPAKQPVLQSPLDEPQVNPPLTRLQDEPKPIPTPKGDPFLDPPVENPKQDPVLPGDAQFNPNPNQQPSLPDPSATDPDLERPDDIDPPPNADETTDQRPQPSNQDQSNPDDQGDGGTEIPQEPVDYLQGKALQEPIAAPPKTYLQPPAQNMPPIVRPNRYAPYNVQPHIYQAPPARAPLYTPDYQPIPGLQAQPQYVVPTPVPSAPGVYVPLVPSADNVYSNVVGQQETFAQCQSAAIECRACGSDCPNFYFSVFGGVTGLRDLKGASGNRKINAVRGGGVGVALGRRNGRNLRTEVEFAYRQNDLTRFVVSPIPAPADAPASGELNSYAGMANAYWEFIDVPTRCFKPYVGIGVGFVSIDAMIRDSTGRNIVPPSAQNDTSFAYQWIGGLNYKAYRNMDLFAEYRLFNADTYRIDPSVPGLGDRYTFKTDNVFLGLRWKF